MWLGDQASLRGGNDIELDVGDGRAGSSSDVSGIELGPPPPILDRTQQQACPHSALQECNLDLVIPTSTQARLQAPAFWALTRM